VNSAAESEGSGGVRPGWRSHPGRTQKSKED